MNSEATDHQEFQVPYVFRKQSHCNLGDRFSEELRSYLGTQLVPSGHVLQDA